MNSLVLTYIILTSVLTALANLCIRKSIDSASNPNGDPYLINRLMGAGFVVILTILLLKGHVQIDPPMIFLGVLGGLLLGLLQWSIGRSVKNGPSGLSFTCVSAGCVVPPLLMALLFGEAYGHTYTLWNAGGALLVLVGLGWMGYESVKGEITESFKPRIWIICVISAFSFNALFMAFFQWRALMLKDGLPESVLLPFHCDPIKGDCFAIAMYATAAALQLFVPGKSSSVPMFALKRWQYGFGGGLINGISGLCLVWATESAISHTEKSLVIPMFSVLLIILCNVWGRVLYKENVNWYANGLCGIGVLVT